MSELSIQQYMNEFRSVYPKTRVRVHASQRGFQVRIDGDKVGEPMTREELESATRNFRAPAPRQPAPFTAKLGDIARFVNKYQRRIITKYLP